MAIPRKGSRQAYVDGVNYRWTLTSNNDLLGVALIVEHAAKPAQRLVRAGRPTAS